MIFSEGNGSLTTGKTYGIVQGPSDVDKNFVFTQGSASNSWTVNHNLEKFPSVTVTLADGQSARNYNSQIFSPMLRSLSEPSTPAEANLIKALSTQTGDGQLIRIFRRETDAKILAASAKNKLVPNKQIIQKHKNSAADKNTPSDLRYEEASGMDGASSKKLRTGKFDIQATLDLHGMTQQNAYLSLQHFIQTCVLNQFRTILVITGKGSKGRGVLRNQFPEWLKTGACAQHVLAFGQALAKDGGSGAFYIRLRRNRGANK